MSKVGAVRTGLCLVFVALGGCSSRSGGLPSGAGGSDGGGVGGNGAGGNGAGGNGGDRFVSTFSDTLNRKLDILFMIDNSQSMLPLQAKLIAQFPVFMNVLKSLPTGIGDQTGLPDIHVAVISSDTGPGKFDLPSYHCTFKGDA